MIFPPLYNDSLGDWREDALCAEVDPELFFPRKGGSTTDARSICKACPVRAECLETAIAGKERDGIWGGMSDRQRRKLEKGRAA